MKNINNKDILIYYVIMSKNDYWLVDKYLPKNIKDFEDKTTGNIYFHRDIIEKLKVVAKDDSMPHIIFYGNKGIGKRTLINLFLELVYDNSIYHLTDTKYPVKSGNNTTTDVLIKQSDHHIIIQPNNNNFDRYLVQDVVKEYAKRKSLDIFTINRNFKLVQIDDLDNMSYYGQTSLRRTIEAGSENCRFVMWCYSLSKVLEPLQSRCLCINIPDISEDELCKWIVDISVKEKIKLNMKNLLEIIKLSKSNLKDILWRLELLKRKHTIKSTSDTMTDELIKNIISPKPNILEIRNLVYNINKNIDGSVIIKNIMYYFLNNKKYNSKYYDIVNYASMCQDALSDGRREIIHIESFIIKIMNLI